MTPSPEAPRNAFVPLALLQDELKLKTRVNERGREERVRAANALLVGGARDDLQERLERALTLEDWDLRGELPPPLEAPELAAAACCSTPDPFDEGAAGAVP